MAAGAADKLRPGQPVEQAKAQEPSFDATGKRPAPGQPDAASSKRPRKSEGAEQEINIEGEKPEVNDEEGAGSEQESGNGQSSSLQSPVSVVLLDIEGTVCPVSFVKDVLFPYALEVLPTTLAKEWSSPSFAPYRDAFPPEHSATPEALTAHVQDLMRHDVKIAYLKSLQGYLWEEGYASGALKAPLFPDVAPKILSWTQQEQGDESPNDCGHEEKAKKKKVRVMIYSSGSVAAQKLLFRHTNSSARPDLTGAITDYFDTVNAGPKTEAASYVKIAAKYPDVPVGEWLFLSDLVKEVEAAKEVGMQSFVLERPGNAELSEEVRRKHRVVKSLDEILI
ncbi:2,3-diketo-5-methylthio-1-phosphopentane phosphatase [Parathielavia appendiculata]|uniref:Enolase-phosphatase E1 n=1 Tax=Parathielavia appendiculata TaxID=2587402 RepID=A0AAN6TZN0_9PEZI|nr:2,3-diketo-5-methylthio-1-phosphopentane phosphatase [Parathielavia appendiculata]